jgi:RHS repeat-associated protein
MLMEGLGTISPLNDYAYNGKELNEDFGLNLSDYGARWYDAALGRWWSVDPLTEDFTSWSSYAYVYDNPVSHIDSDGLFGKDIHGEITREAAGAAQITNQKTINSLIRGAKDPDNIIGRIQNNPANGKLHFDNKENKEEIDETWSEVKDRIAGSDNAHDLGVNLHTVQDFYAHSNYVELFMQFYEEQGGDVSALDPSSVPLYEDASPELQTYLGENGLRTGEYDFIDDAVLKNSKNNGPNHHENMSKDNPDKPKKGVPGSIQGSKTVKGNSNTYHAFAKNLAVRASTKIIQENEDKID